MENSPSKENIYFSLISECLTYTNKIKNKVAMISVDIPKECCKLEATTPKTPSLLEEKLCELKWVLKDLENSIDN